AATELVIPQWITSQVTHENESQSYRFGTHARDRIRNSARWRGRYGRTNPSATCNECDVPSADSWGRDTGTGGSAQRKWRVGSARRLSQRTRCQRTHPLLLRIWRRAAVAQFASTSRRPAHPDVAERSHVGRGVAGVCKL